VCLGDGRVEHKTERSEEMRDIIMRNWDIENFVCESIDLPNTAGTSSDPVGIITDTRSAKPNQESCSPDVS